MVFIWIVIPRKLSGVSQSNDEFVESDCIRHVLGLCRVGSLILFFFKANNLELAAIVEEDLSIFAPLVMVFVVPNQVVVLALPQNHKENRFPLSPELVDIVRGLRESSCLFFDEKALLYAGHVDLVITFEALLVLVDLPLMQINATVDNHGVSRGRLRDGNIDILKSGFLINAALHSVLAYEAISVLSFLLQVPDNEAHAESVGSEHADKVIPLSP